MIYHLSYFISGVDILGVGAEMRALARTRELTAIPEDIANMLLYDTADDSVLDAVVASASNKGIGEVRNILHNDDNNSKGIGQVRNNTNNNKHPGLPNNNNSFTGDFMLHAVVASCRQ